jgi:beta-lactamase class D
MNNSFLKKASYREKGFRRWEIDITQNICYTAHPHTVEGVTDTGWFFTRTVEEYGFIEGWAFKAHIRYVLGG